MDIEKIATLIKENGGNTYLVGGAVRDAILDKPIKDEDYCITGFTSEKFLKLFPNARVRGKSFEVFDLEGKEFALARKETKVGKGHKEFAIETSEEITIEEDLKRRDITINSIAQDALTKEIIDPFGGRDDLESGIIRATSSRFSEDPLRVYRVARIAAILDFKVSRKTLNMMNKLKDELPTLSKERVFVEFRKALEADKPSIFFNVLKEAGVLDIHFKEIYDLIGSIQPIEYHPEGDSYNHTMIVLDNSAKLTDNLEIRYASLVHDLGKGLTPKEILPHHYGHDERGVEPERRLSNRIGVPTSWKKAGITSCKEHMRGGIFSQMTPEKQVSFIERVEKSVLGLHGLQIVVYGDKNRTGTLSEEKRKKCTFEQIGQELLTKIDGEYIKEKYKNIQGQEFGEKLHQERVRWMKMQHRIK